MSRVIRGTSRNDRLTGTGASDRLYGLAGNDVLDGGSGNDVLVGGDGADVMRFSGVAKAVASLSLTSSQNTGYGLDTIRGIENLAGGRGPDRFVGDATANVLSGNGGKDTLLGGAGNDQLLGGAGDDGLIGGAGHDRLLGGSGNDVMIGGAGDDTFLGGPGNDLYRGDRGSDTAVLSGRVPLRVDLRITGPQNTGQGVDRFVGIENVTATGSTSVISGNKAANKLTCGSASDTISGYGGNDTIAGNAGDDVLDGGDGDDLLSGGAGNDRLVGGTGIDTANYGATLSGVVVDLAAGTATGEGTDVLFTIENVTGGSGHDALFGNAAANRLVGGAGNDRLEGRAGNDVLDGGVGNDTIDGGDGDDVVDAGAGSDTVMFTSGTDRVSTGEGADRVAVGPGATGALTITDFTAGLDVLDLSSQGAFAKVSAGALSGSGVSEIAVTHGSGSTLLAIDRGGDGTAELTITINGDFDLYHDALASLPNRSPVAQDDHVWTVVGTPVKVNVLANDSDPDGNALGLTLGHGATNGTVTLNNDKTFTYTPNAGWTGTDSFTYRIDDGHGGYATATATVQVSPSSVSDGYTRQFYAARTSGESGQNDVRTFYVDPDAGSDANTGLGEGVGAAWQSLDHAAGITFQAGDRILLKRGCTYDSQNGFKFKGEGSLEHPIVLGAYGDGAPPVLTNSNGPSINDAVLTIDQTASFFNIRDIKIDNPNATNITETGIRVYGTHVTVDNVEITRTGVGVAFARNDASGMNLSDEAYGLVQNCFIHDLTMVVDTYGAAGTSAANDDYGCQGVLIGASEVTVKHNTFTNLMSHSHDYRWDGAAVELWGSANNISVHGNYVENANAFTEVGGRSNDFVTGLSFDHNIIVNSESLAFFHNGNSGGYGLGGLSNVNFVYNTVYSTGNRDDSFSFAFGFAGTEASFLNVENNIFAMQALDAWDTNATSYLHKNNFYDYAPGSIPFGGDYFTGEYQGYASFADAAAHDFHLTSGSAALSRATSLTNFLTDYVEHSLVGRTGLDIGAIEYWV